jgi:hypothetical protein
MRSERVVNTAVASRSGVSGSMFVSSICNVRDLWFFCFLATRLDPTAVDAEITEHVGGEAGSSAERLVAWPSCS